MSWYLFRVKPGREREMVEGVIALGHQAASPEIQYRVRKHWRSKSKENRSYPVLRSHILVGFDGEPQFRKVIDLQFVSGVVGLGSYASRIPDGQVKSFLDRNRWDRASVGKLLQDWVPEYTKGDTVRLSGAFEGIIGTVTDIDLHSRMSKVEINLLGADREVCVSALNLTLTQNH